MNITGNNKYHMGRDIKLLLNYETKRNPYLKQILSDVDSLSEDEIQNLKFKPWIRKALKLAKIDNKRAQHYLITATEIINNTRFFLAPDTNGKMFQYIGERRFVKIDKGELELREGALFWIPDTGGVWYESIFCKTLDPIIHGKILNSCSRSQYMASCRQRSNGLI